MGSYHGMSAAILAPGGNLDPEFWMLCLIFRTARLFLLKSSAEDRQVFLQIASRFGGSLALVKGPASTLGFCLRQLGWTMTCQGVVWINGFIHFDLCGSSFFIGSRGFLPSLGKKSL